MENPPQLHRWICAVDDVGRLHQHVGVAVFLELAEELVGRCDAAGSRGGLLIDEFAGGPCLAEVVVGIGLLQPAVEAVYLLLGCGVFGSDVYGYDDGFVAFEHGFKHVLLYFCWLPYGGESGCQQDEKCDEVFVHVVFIRMGSCRQPL